MKIVWSWLRELVELDREITADEAARALTHAGLEVEGIERVGAFEGVVLAEVISAEKHPQADRLTLVQVTDGGPATLVVCGAPNVPAPGGRVLWARPGARLPKLEIGTRTIKGVESAGMLCSETELEVGDDASGIIVLQPEDGHVALGTDAGAALGMRDVVLEVNAPANRPDALGHLGVARELAAIVGGRLRPPAADLAELTDAALAAEQLTRVDIDDPQGCPRYIARVIDRVRVGPSPRKLRNRLRAIGVRPISNLVDVSNYVMFELGQPLHAFDYDKLADSRIRVRRARSHEKLTTLDGVERQLHDGELLICDGQRPVALGGVMGGLDTEVTERTSRVLLEAAGFDPGSVRRTARRLGLHSEASHRFERHVDTNITELASRRAAELLARLGGGRVAAGSVDAHPRPAAPRTVSIRVSRTQQLTGVPVDAPTITGTLARLGLEPSAPAENISVVVPTFRPDLEREVDLIEEVLRLHGFENVPATIPYSEVPPRALRDPRRSLARRALTGAGMAEAITFGFTSPTRVAAMRLPGSDRRTRPVALRNPMTVEQSVMRTSLVPNLLGATARNVSFGVTDVRLFEIGSVFLPRGAGELPDEPVYVAGVVAGNRPAWLEQKPQPVDFFDVKGMVEQMLAALLGDAARGVTFTADPHVAWLHPGVSAAIALADGTHLGHVGEVHPETRRALDAPPSFAFEIDLGVVPLPQPAQMRPISRHPAVTRDVSFLVDAAVPSARIAELIADAREPLVEGYGVLEDFRDPAHVPAGKKGMLWTITYRAGDRTLTDAEVDRAHEGIVQRLLTELDAQRR